MTMRNGNSVSRLWRALRSYLHFRDAPAAEQLAMALHRLNPWRAQ